MLINKAMQTTALFMGMSLAACVAPTEPQTTNVPAVDDAPVATAPEAPAVSDPIVDASFRSGGGNWERVGSILFRYTAIERNGEIYICGAYTGRGSTSIRRLSREVMRQASASANGETFSRNMQYFREASNSAYSSGLVGVQTNCRTTGRAAGSVPLDTVTVGTRSGRYSISR